MKTFYLSVELESREQEVEIEVEVYGVWDNDGIGAYEYGSQRCFDRGESYFTIENWTWDTTGYSVEEVAAIESAIEKNIGDWAAQIEPEEPDYED